MIKVQNRKIFYMVKICFFLMYIKSAWFQLKNWDAQARLGTFQLVLITKRYVIELGISTYVPYVGIFAICLYNSFLSWVSCWLYFSTVNPNGSTQFLTFYYFCAYFVLYVYTYMRNNFDQNDKKRTIPIWPGQLDL